MVGLGIIILNYFSFNQNTQFTARENLKKKSVT